MKLRGWLLLGVLAAGLARVSPLVAKPEIDFVQGSEKRVSIDLRDSDLVDVLKFLAQKGHFNIVVSPTIQGRVTLYLQDVKIADIIDIILQSHKLAYTHTDNIVYVMTQEEYKTQYGEDYADARDVHWLRLKYAAPSQIFKMLDPVKSKIGSIVADEQSGTIILIDTPEKIKFMLEVIEELDQPLETRVFDLSYAKAADVQSLVTSQIEVKGSVSIHADTRSNQVVVTAPVRRMREIAKMIEKVDRKTREVAIDAQIVKVVLNKANKKGINWEYVRKSGFLEPLDVNVNLPETLTSFGSLGYDELAAKGFKVFLNFLQSFGESKILASPRITVVEGEEAKILIGTREAYVTSTTTTGSSTSTVSESVSFIDVGISLNVSAFINKQGYVTMKIKPEVSSVVRTLVTPSNNQIPIVDTTQAETRVMIKDGSTIVIGGLRKDERIRSSNQIPFFNKLPVIGAAFKQNDDALEQTELIVFLTPHVLRDNKNHVYDQDRTPKGIEPYDGKAAASAVPDKEALAAASVSAGVLAAPKDINVKGLEPMPKKG